MIGKLHRSYSSAIFLAMVVAGCATPTAQQDQPEVDAAALAAVEEVGYSSPTLSSVPLRGLPPQNLEPGDCGLFLWSQTGASKFIFFRRAGEGYARLLIGEENTPLIATDFSGDLFGQFFTKQEYDAQNSSLKVDLEFTAGEDLIDGARISSGRFRITDPDGWVTTIPVLGVRACRPTPEDDSDQEF